MLRKCSAGVWESWQKVCTTKVADVGQTAITSDGSVCKDILGAYYVVNGQCNLNIECQTKDASSDAFHTWVIINTTGVPKSKYTVKFPLVCHPSGRSIVATVDANTTQVKIYGTIPSGTTNLFGHASYQVAES